MSVLFGQLISRLKLALGPSERKEILEASVASHHVFTCQQLGIILMHLKYSSEREIITTLLAPQVIDVENVNRHLLPFIARENQGVRQQILDSVINCNRAAS